jgi:muramidase (phage lysozyme)
LKFTEGQNIKGQIGQSNIDYVQVTSLRGNREGGYHGGMDIAAPTGTYIALGVDCEVVATDNQPEGYGRVIDVWISQYGVQLRFAHNSSIIITSGKIPSGTSFARVGSTGKSTGPHIHLEADTRKGSASYGGSMDPSRFVPLISLTKSPSKPTPAPASVASSSTSQPQQNLMGTSSSSSSSGGGTKEQRAMLDAIAFAEGTRDQPNGGYKTLFGFGQFEDYSKHPDKVVRSGRYESAAAGRYQFMPGTFNRLAKKLGLKDFSPASQDKAAIELSREYGVTQELLAKEGMSPKVSALLGGQWASFPGKTIGLDQPTKKLGGIQKAYQISLGSPQQANVASAQTSAPAQLASQTQSQSQISQSSQALTPERTGPTVIVTQNPSSPARQMMYSGGGGSSGGGSPQMSDFALLNNFIKNKLLLDLAYL